MPLYEDAPTSADTFLNSSLIANRDHFHSAIKPYLDVDLVTFRYTTTSRSAIFDGTGTGIDREHSLPIKRLGVRYYYGNTFTEKATPSKFAFLIRPIYDLNVGYDVVSKRLLTTTVGGAILDADYKQKIGIELRCAAGTSTLPNYLDSIAKFSGMMPGWGDRAYPNGKASYSFQHFSGNLIWRPSKIFNLQVGRDKHFWGDGYRSLFLSDCGTAMPYIKQTTTIWKLQYTSLFAWMQDWTNSNGSAKDFRNKFGTFHYISFNATKWLNLGVFESVIWQGNDNNRMRGFDPNYLNPIVFFRPVEYSLGSSDNVMLGFAFKFRLNANNQLYSQILLDEFYLKEVKKWKNGWWANKQGLQIGYKIFNVHKIQNLNAQFEMNIVRPYTYTHGSSQQNYSNAGMPLAHPLGANFRELVGLASYSKGQFSVTAKLIEAKYGLDSIGKDYGQNIFIPYTQRSSTNPLKPNATDYGHHMFDGIVTKLVYFEVKGSYTLKTKFPLRVELLAGERKEQNGVMGIKKSAYVQVGLTLPLWRTYRDY
jgi:hypothetical protein